MNKKIWTAIGIAWVALVFSIAIQAVTFLAMVSFFVDILWECGDCGLQGMITDEVSAVLRAKGAIIESGTGSFGSSPEDYYHGDFMETLNFISVY